MALFRFIPYRLRGEHVNWPLVVSLALLAVLFASVSLVNHYCFRSSALDYGFYCHGVYQYAHGELARMTLIEPRGELQLTDHFAIWPLLVSPLWWVLGSYTLLVVQLAFILLGLWGCYRLVVQEDGRAEVATLSVWFMGLSWGVLSALAFDYHDNVLAAMLLPWLAWAVRNRRRGLMLLCFGGMLLAKENQGIWLFFVCGALAFVFAPDRRTRLTCLALSGAALLAFVLTLKVIVPALYAESRPYGHS